MSLTRDEWLKMWNSIKVIESVTIDNYFETAIHDRDLLEDCIKDIKKKIQQVIGQME